MDPQPSQEGVEAIVAIGDPELLVDPALRLAIGAEGATAAVS
jgi:hypothetical protein